MPIDLNSIILGAIGAGGLVGAAAAPSFIQAGRWRKQTKAEEAKAESETNNLDAKAAQALVSAAGTLVQNALDAQVQSKKDGDDLRSRIENLQRQQDEQKSGNERVIEGLRQDHQAALRKVRSDYESEFEALHRQIEGLVLRNARLESELITERDKNRQVQALSDQQQEQLISQQSQIDGLKAQLRALQSKDSK